MYVLDTYSTPSDPLVDLTFTVFFTVDLLLQTAAAPERLQFLLSPMAIVDVLAITPVYLEWLVGTNQGSSLSFLRFVRVLRVMRILRTFKVINSGMSAIHRQTITLALTVTSIVFLAAGLVHLFEGELYSSIEQNENLEPMTFGTALWFIIVTLSTVGFGDVVPDSRLGQLITALFIVGSIVLIPMQVNQLTGLLALQSRFRTTYRRGDSIPPHILIIGHVSNACMLEDFLGELYHPDRALDEDGLDTSLQAVIVGPDEPTEGVQTLLLSPVLDTKVRYIRGSVMSTDDLWRVAADTAEACFVLSDYSADDPGREDRACALRTLMVKNFNPALKVFVHMLGGKALQQVQQSEVEEAVSVQEWKARLLAQSALVPGFSTLVNNIMRSATVPDLNLLPPWMKEYAGGAGLEVYPVPVPGMLDGMEFTELVELVYSTFDGQAIVWGVQDPAISRSDPQALDRIEYIQGRARRNSGPATAVLCCSPFSPRPIPGQVRLNPGRGFTVSAAMTMFVLAEDESVALAVGSNEAYGPRTASPVPGHGGGSGDPPTDRWTWSHRNVGVSHGQATGECASPATQAGGWKVLQRRLRQRAQARRVRSNMPDEASTPTHLPPQTGPGARPTAAMSPLSQWLAGDMIVDDVRDVEGVKAGHIVVCGDIKSFSGLLQPLRASHLRGTSLFKTVVLLTDEVNMEEVHACFQESTDMTQVFMVKGSPHSVSDLRRAGISTAGCAIIPSTRQQVSKVDGATLDATVLFSYLVLEQTLLAVSTRPDFYVLVEMTTMDNLQILNRKRLARMQVLDASGKADQAVRRMIGTATAAAELPSDGSQAGRSVRHGRKVSVDSIFSMEDSSHRLQLEEKVQELQHAREVQEQHEHTIDFASFNSGATMPFFAAGYGYATDTLHTMLCQAFFSRDTMRFADELLSPDPGAASRLMAVPVPARYHSLSFGVLFFDVLSHHGAVCVGLYRCRSALGAPLSYVVTGPDPELKLHSTDRDADLMYVLVTRPLDLDSPPRADTAAPQDMETPGSLLATPSAASGSWGSVSPRRIVLELMKRPGATKTSSPSAAMEAKPTDWAGGEQ